MVDLSMLEWLEEWYQGQCNGDWEHQYGIKIDTIDNPGWEVSIDLHGTQLYGRKFTDVSFQYGDEIDWFFVTVKDGTFKGFGVARNLSKIIEQFKKFAMDTQR
ncbi:immunity 53 family protein [Mesorhizobium sp. M0199]|uniref:immunity 53 family protein n=2 Tax=Mesorhizobium TaxID=68287 RepID=UPI00333B6D1E